MTYLSGKIRRFFRMGLIVMGDLPRWKKECEEFHKLIPIILGDLPDGIQSSVMILPVTKMLAFFTGMNQPVCEKRMWRIS